VRRIFGPKTEKGIDEWEKSRDKPVFVIERAGEMLLA
jgi:hypothetical protein